MTSDGFFCAGDVGCMDEDGRLFIVDRTKDMLLVGGVNVDRRDQGDDPAAFFRAFPRTPGPQPEGLRQAQGGRASADAGRPEGIPRDRLRKHEMIGALEIRDELPKTPAGKIPSKTSAKPSAPAPAERFRRRRLAFAARIS